MKKLVLFTLICLLGFSALPAAAEHRLGGGLNYWIAVEDIDFDDVNNKGVSLFASYQYWTGLFGVELDIDFLPDRFGETAFAPEAYILVGRGIYAGLGIGTVYSDGNFASEPFFALKAGLNLEILPKIYLDIYANYHFNESAEFDNLTENIDTDTVFLGAAVRFAL